ncbi:unnamed protein product [Prunus armeniaca]|uniref:Amidase domain-containing protein n=1 Tax=Prunus armeniaca TaxID=36596 RepID=A0A6J5Y9T3_PRUAR|nr:unnamed protein product [Prunus armeniaca]
MILLAAGMGIQLHLSGTGRYAIMLMLTVPRLQTPSVVAEHIISVVEEFSNKKPPQPLLISFNPEEVRSQAAASTKRFEEGNPLSILDGIFVAIKDDIDCFPHPSKGGTTWMHEVRTVKKDAVSVSRLRSCGVIFVGKANMHELGMGTTGNNSNYGLLTSVYVTSNSFPRYRVCNAIHLEPGWFKTARNPHAPERYTGGSSSGPAAIVASGLCSAALGTDGGGSIRIPSSLCGVVGLKTTYGRTDIGGSLCDAGTVEIIGPIASTVEDVMLVYSAILGTSRADRISLNPSPPSVPNLSFNDSLNSLGSLRLGKYTAWFNDVYSTDISDKCEDTLNLLSKLMMVEIVVPELHEMRTAHLVSIGSECLSSLNPYCEDGNGARLSYDTRTSMALFRSFSASDYVAAQCLRRRIMYYHMEIFKKVDVIVTPTTGMTAPIIPLSALKDGETDMRVTGYLMRFVIAGNLLGLPAISIPVGYDKQGFPIGLQLIGRPWGEASILRLALAIEELCAKSKKRPASFFDVVFKASIRYCKCFGARMIVGPLQISRLNAPGRGDVRQHVTSSFGCGAVVRGRASTVYRASR